MVRVTTEELLQKERERTATLLNRNLELEDALLELAEIIGGGDNGEDIRTED